jgi:hypothetical protein
MLSDEEKQGLLAEAEDPRRREVLNRFRRARMRERPDEFLELLSQALKLFDPDGAHHRRRPKISGSQFLL